MSPQALLRALATKVYMSLIVSAVWYGGARIDWPRPWVIAGAVLTAVALAGAALFISWWTRTLGDGIPAVERIIRGLVWLGLLAVVALWMIAAPATGILGGAFLAYVAGHTWSDRLDRVWRWIRREHQAPLVHPWNGGAR